MSKLNPNAGEWVPSFSAPAPAPSPAKSSAVSPAKGHAGQISGASGAGSPSPGATDAKATESNTGGKTALARAADYGHDASLTEDGAEISYEGYSPLHDRFIYSKEYLKAFQPLGDHVIARIPDVVRNPSPPKKIGSKTKGKLVYSVEELLQFQPLYEMMPEDFTWADTIGADAVVGDKKGKKGKQKDKNRQQHGMSMQYDSSLVCYFNPTEYAAAMNKGLYTGPPATDTTESSGTADGKGKANPVEVLNPVEEAVIAKRRLATLLDDVKPETVDSIVESFVEISVTCTHTLQEIIDLLFDHAIADPSLSDSYARLCTGMSERTPEFKDGAKTVNFRRILLTKCYESLIEEPESQPTNPSKHKAGGNSQNGVMQQHSWRRKCMLSNVGFIGELFRRQLLTENVMHVCVAMMLDDEIKPQAEIIEAACGLVSLVGDLLDGSSPASRRTMDEYFAVLARLGEHSQLPAHVKTLIADLAVLRTSGWIKRRQEGSSSASTTPAASPAKPATVDEAASEEKPGLAPSMAGSATAPAVKLSPSKVNTK